MIEICDVPLREAKHLHCIIAGVLYICLFHVSYIILLIQT